MNFTSSSGAGLVAVVLFVVFVDHFVLVDVVACFSDVVCHFLIVVVGLIVVIVVFTVK